MVKGAEVILERFSLVSEQADKLLASLDIATKVLDAGGTATISPRQDPGAVNPTPSMDGNPGAPSIGSGLTKEARRANREKGNAAQFKFVEETLR